MKEKINRLAKGIMENDRPEAELFPASFDEEITFGESGRREFQLRSKNGIGVKGLCYSDNPRVLVEDAVITGNRNRIIFRVDPSFLKEFSDGKSEGEGVVFFLSPVVYRSGIASAVPCVQHDRIRHDDSSFSGSFILEYARK